MLLDVFKSYEPRALFLRVRPPWHVSYNFRVGAIQMHSLPIMFVEISE